MYITFNKIRIRNAEAADAEQLAAWWNDGAVMAHAGFPKGLGTTPEAVSRQISGYSDEKGGVHIIEYDKRPIGEMNYRNIGDQTAEMGIKICDPHYQEKGLGRIILSLFIQGLFDMGFEKIALDTNLKNTRAQHVYEKLGFRKLRVNVDSWTNQLGEMQSSVDYELTPECFRSFVP